MPDGRPWPRISIVTPSYNQGRFIEETIRSVLLQGYPNLEYIMMDGGSSDATPEILRRYRQFINYLCIGPDGGQAAAIGSGFRRATGEIFAYLNSDDRYQPGALARVGRYFSDHPKVAFVNSDVNHIDEHSRFIARSHLAGPCHTITANTGWHNCLQQGCFWRRSAYEQCGGMDGSLEFCMDRDLFVRLTRAGPYRRIGGPPHSRFPTPPLGEVRDPLRQSGGRARYPDRPVRVAGSSPDDGTSRAMVGVMADSGAHPRVGLRSKGP